MRGIGATRRPASRRCSGTSTARSRGICGAWNGRVRPRGGGGGRGGPGAGPLREKTAALQQRRARYETLHQELAASGETARSLTDPDSRPMMSGGRIEVCYNVQTVVDAKHKLIVAEDVTNAAGDRDQLSPMAPAAQEILPGPAPAGGA